MSQRYQRNPRRFMVDGSSALKEEYNYTSIKRKRNTQYQEKRKQERIAIIEQKTNEAKEEFILQSKLAPVTSFFVHLALVAVVLMAAVFGFYTLTSHAKTVSANFDNTKLKNEIKALEKQNQELRAKIHSGIDLNLIEAQAKNLHNLQSPAKSQILNIYVPLSDSIQVFGSLENVGESSGQGRK